MFDGYLGAQRGRLAHAHLPSGEKVGQARSFDQVADDVDGLLVPAHLVNANDARMVELRGGPRFAEKFFDVLRGKLVSPGNLHRHRAVQLSIVGSPHGPKGAGSQRLEQLEVTDGLGFRGPIGGRLGVHQAEAAVARGTGDFTEQRVVENLDRMMTMRTADANGPAAAATRRI